MQQSIQDLGVAFKNCFDDRKGKRKGPRVGFPRFKKKANQPSARFTRGGFSLTAAKVYLAKIGEVKVKWSRPLPSDPSSVTVIKDCAGRYFLSNVSGMVKNRALSRAISRAGWRQIRTLWEAKADMIHDREVQVISRWEPTSQGCSCCGYRWGTLALAIRSVVCLNCGTVHDRDVNASVNIVAAGQAVPNGQTLSRVRPQSGAVAGLSTHQEAI